MISIDSFGEVFPEPQLALGLLASMALGLLVGIERGWHQRGEADGGRVAGIRTFALIGSCGGVVGTVALVVSQTLAAILLVGLLVLVLAAFLRGTPEPGKQDATTMVAAMLTLCLGLLAGAGHAALALAGGAVTTFVLAGRAQAHGFLNALSPQELRAIARYAVIAGAVLPFLPNADYGPYDAWNPFQLWLVVLLVSGFSVAGYVANRTIGQNRGTIMTALIGGAYSSTAVTAAFASRLKEGSSGPFATGIALASAVMYLRVMLLATILAPRIGFPLTKLLGPAAFAAFVVAGLVWRREQEASGSSTRISSKPFELFPALLFLLAVGAASLLVRWAEAEFGQTGGALSLFLAGSFDVDAALVAYSTLPADAVPVQIAALALAGTVAVNMAFKTGVVFVAGGMDAGRGAGMALLASLAVLLVALAWQAVVFWA